MLARVLYSAVALCVLGAFPRAGGGPAAGPRARPAPTVVQPAWSARGEAEPPCVAAAGQGIGWNPPDFAIPRIDR